MGGKLPVGFQVTQFLTKPWWSEDAHPGNILLPWLQFWAWEHGHSWCRETGGGSPILRCTWSGGATTCVPAELWQVHRIGLHARYILRECVLKVDIMSVFVVIVQSPNHIRLFATLWAAAHQASLSSPSPEVCPSSCPLNRWCHPTIPSSLASTHLGQKRDPTSPS